MAFDEHEVVLDGQLGEKGPADRRDRNKVEDFRTHFFDETRSIQLEYIHVDRSAGPSKVSGEYQYHTSALGEIVAVPDGSRRRQSPRDEFLAQKVRDFVREAQVNYRRFFRQNEPNLMSGILARLKSGGDLVDVNVDELRARYRELSEVRAASST